MMLNKHVIECGLGAVLMVVGVCAYEIFPYPFGFAQQHARVGAGLIPVLVAAYALCFWAISRQRDFALRRRSGTSTRIDRLFPAFLLGAMLVSMFAVRWETGLGISTDLLVATVVLAVMSYWMSPRFGPHLRP
jgi:ABC-type xylose transport system permease subunit